ncbi:hypothetical protein [Streptomyces sp. G-G2]|uniref:hypothetical protein n=1 Tax=Streptomyces sp. G-G2 TaxID=3046201 RepID=UPI0024BB4446|nr:hypothetical protein [Streptomyces sp. G-G2]MDJ0386133.1 hypothetical protein [Streptomyces sp. G-G2]
MLPTATLEDSRLSFRARGILAYLLAKPDSWRVAADRISNAGKEGVEAVRTALRELRDAGYYRVVTERLADGTFHRVTEVYDQAQEWAAAEFRQSEERRVARRAKQPGGRKPAGSVAVKEGEAGTETGFSGFGSPGAGDPGLGSPVGGSPGVIGSNQIKYSEKNPPTPAAGAAGEPLPAAEQTPAGAPGSGSCPAHPAGGGRSCRGCGTSPRQQRADEERAKKDAYQERERVRDERVLSEVRSDGAPLSALAADAIAEMRLRNREVKEKTAQERRQKRK